MLEARFASRKPVGLALSTSYVFGSDPHVFTVVGLATTKDCIETDYVPYYWGPVTIPDSLLRRGMTSALTGIVRPSVQIVGLKEQGRTFPCRPVLLGDSPI